MPSKGFLNLEKISKLKHALARWSQAMSALAPKPSLISAKS